LTALEKNDIGALKQYLEKLYNDDDTKKMYKEKSEIEAVISTINALIQLAQSSSASSSGPSSPSRASEPPSSSSTIADAPFKFKIGFEFQEENNLCPWAYDNLSIQKNPIFNVISESKILWRLEIDGKDIEFITEPFANDDISRLRSCIESIEQACRIISELTKAKGDHILFKEWLGGFKISPAIRKTINTLISHLNKQIAKKPKSLTICEKNPEIVIVVYCVICHFKENVQQILEMIERLQQYSSLDIDNAFLQCHQMVSQINGIKKIQDMANELIKENPTVSSYKTAIQKQIESITVITPGLLSIAGIDIRPEKIIYEKVMDCHINVNQCWEAKFVPHVTIQHPLKDSIPLIISLFSSITNINSLSTIEQNILFSIPCKNETKGNVQYFLTNEYLTEENGLLFLHALTCAGIQKEKDPIKAFSAIEENFFKGQVDPKISLYFLCRRPFSSMWADVKKIKESLVFYDLYNQRIIKGNSFFQKIIVPNFQFINYGEEYYNNTLSTRVNFSSVPTCQQYPSSLLGKGIVSTSLIRHFQPTIFDGYLNKVIISVDNPGIKHSILDHAKFPEIIITEIDIHTDLLSPPWFLELNNSMGAYTNEKLDGQHFDPSYGEAILEMRFIRFISTEALGRMKRTQRPGQFLTRKANSLKEDVIDLLSILNYEFIREKYKQEISKMTAIKD
jgi:hypothetical protein